MISHQEITAYVEAHYEEAIALLETLGKIPAPSHFEDERAQFCCDWFTAQGAEKAWIDKAKNAICSIGADNHSDLVVFMAHTDVVFPDTEPLPMKRNGDILAAPGIGDDTANLVNLMFAAKYLIETNPKTDMGILVVANACEEGLGNLDGCKEIMKTYGRRIKAFYSFDGFMPQCTDKPVGSHRYKIIARAEGGHSYENFGNPNAIVLMAEVIRALGEIKLPTAEKTTSNVGYIEGGTTVNSIPAECYCLYEYRSPNEKCLEIMQQSLTAVIDGFQKRGCDVSLELLGIRPGKGEFEAGVLESFTARTMEQISAYYDGEINRAAYSTDANVPLSMGIPANTVGTVIGEKAHTRDEWVDLRSMKPGMSIALGLMGMYVS